MDKDRVKKLTERLKQLGVKKLGLIAPEVKVLNGILAQDEDIGGVVYGSYVGGLAWLVATDKRILFIDRKPFFNSIDEISYEVVAGIKSSSAGLFSSVILHTRMGDYTVRYANAKSAQTFIKYVEMKQLHVNTKQPKPITEVKLLSKDKNNEADGLAFLKSHDTAVLSTVSKSGNVSGAVIYYVLDQNNTVYILTKSDTEKSKNIYESGQVALTIYDGQKLQTLQLTGEAEIVIDQTVKDMVFNKMSKPRKYADKEMLPPVTKIHEGSFIIIRITLTELKFHDYAKEVA